MSNLTKTQVRKLNEKHGWFEFGDAQSSVSNHFANDAVEAYLSMREAAPDMYEALEYCIECLGDEFALPIDVIDQARAALAKADGKGE